MIDLLQANLQQLDEIKVSIETHGQTIASMLSQLIHVVSHDGKFSMSHHSHASNEMSNGGSNRIDDAISATIRDIGISQENL